MTEMLTPPLRSLHNDYLILRIPETRLEIKILQDQGKKVIMVGDGMNNAPELIGLGGGTCAACHQDT